MLQDWKSGIINNDYGLDAILNNNDSLMQDYNKFKDTQQTVGMLNNMGAFGNNTNMSNFADKFSTWGSNGEGGVFFGGGEGGASPLGYIGIAQNGLKGLQEGLNAGNNPDEEVIAGGFGNGVQGFFGSNDYDNDIAQAIAGTTNGAKMGSTFGPWGAAAGAVLGLGSSFLDDL